MIICDADNGTTHFIHTGKIGFLDRFNYKCHSFGQRMYAFAPRNTSEFLEFLTQTNLGERTPNGKFGIVSSIAKPSTGETYNVAFEHVLSHFLKGLNITSTEYDAFIKDAINIRDKKVREMEDFVKEYNEHILKISKLLASMETNIQSHDDNSERE